MSSAVGRPEDHNNNNVALNDNDYRFSEDLIVVAALWDRAGNWYMLDRLRRAPRTLSSAREK